MAKLSRELVVRRLLAANGAWYDTHSNYEFCGHMFAGYCEFHSHGEQYVLVKRAKLWEVDAHDYLFLDSVDHVDEEYLTRAIAFMETSGLTKVDPKPNHMQSSLSLVLIADAVDEEAKKLCRRTRFRKNFMLGLRGWSDLRLAIVDLSSGDVTTNGAGKELRRSLEANLAPEHAGAREEEARL